jgi:hypothetical protein
VDRSSRHKPQLFFPAAVEDIAAVYSAASAICDLKGFAPALCTTSTPCHYLSRTAVFHRALLRAGVDAQLMVFNGMPHAVRYRFDLPEPKATLEVEASFLDRHPGLTGRYLHDPEGPADSVVCSW